MRGLVHVLDFFFEVKSLQYAIASCSIPQSWLHLPVGLTCEFANSCLRMQIDTFITYQKRLQTFGR
jgi:hypothetical protein